MEDNFHELRRVRVDETGDWIFTDPRFVSWNDGANKEARILLIHGPPGSGKSVLASRIIDHLSDSDKSDAACVFTLCRHDEDCTHDIKRILRTAIFDLSKAIDVYRLRLESPQGIAELTAGNLNSLPFLWQKLLIQQLEKSNFTGSIKWVIDGLDETDSAQLSTFLWYLADLRYVKIDFKILIVCRYNMEIESKMKLIGSGVVELNVESNGSDIRKVIHHHIRCSERLSADHIVNKVTSLLERRSRGLFLWVRLVFEELAKMTTDEDVINCVGRLPLSLSQMYERTLDSLTASLSVNDLWLSKEIFKWTIAACRPFSIDELTNGLEPLFGRLTNLRVEIKRCCGGLIVVDSSQKVRLLHMTLAEYAKQTTSFFIDSETANVSLTTTCLTSIPQHDSVSRLLSVEEFDEVGWLAPYSCLYWWQHVIVTRETNEQVSDLVLKFLTTPQFLTWIRFHFLAGKHSVLVHAMEKVSVWAKRRLTTERDRLLHDITVERLADLRELMQDANPGSEHYDGAEKDGRRHGYGSCLYEMGDRYTGDWEDGQRHGFGRLDFKITGNYFEGNWKNGRQDGNGVWRFSDGVSYDGEWIQGVAQAGGMWIFADGTTQVHTSDEDTNLPNLTYINYKGTCTIPTHDALGKFEEGSDPLVWIYPNGSRYIGDWKGTLEHGRGVWQCVCGCEYHGSMKDGREHGEGVWHYRSGNKLTGTWKEGRAMGHGVLLFHTGREYSGNWISGKADGPGTMTFTNGNHYTGIWRGGKLFGKSVIRFGSQWQARFSRNS